MITRALSIEGDVRSLPRLVKCMQSTDSIPMSRHVGRDVVLGRGDLIPRCNAPCRLRCIATQVGVLSPSAISSGMFSRRLPDM